MSIDIARTAVLVCVVGAGALGASPLAAQTPPQTNASPAQSKPRPAQVAPAARAQSNTSAKTADEVIAHLGSIEITARELRGYIDALGPREQAAFAKEPALFGQLVRAILGERLVLDEALAKKWDQSPNVAAQLQQTRDRALVELYLQSVSAPPASYPSEEELQKAYDANRSLFVVPRQFQVGHIFIAAAKDADRATEEKAKKKLEEVQRKVKTAGADFVSIARAESDARDNGELGWISEGQIRPEIRTQVMGLGKGVVSEPIRLDDGWHIVKLIDTKAAYTRPFAEAREALAQQMRTERSTLLRRAYVAELLKQHPPIINEIALSNLLDGALKH